MFDRKLHGHWEPPQTPASLSLIESIATEARAENQAAAQRLGLIGNLFEMRRAECGEEEHWAVDTWAAVATEIAAALRISVGKAETYLIYASAMPRLPRVAMVFANGDIDMATFQTIVYRTQLITDEGVRAAVDRRIATWVSGCPSLSRGRLIREIDAIIRAHDPDAVRRARDYMRGRDVTVWDNKDGTADISGRLFCTDAHLLDKRLDELAATVCVNDPRTKENLRADAMGVLAAGAERLMCRCGDAQCPATAPTRSGVVIHVVAEQSSLDETSQRPAYLMGADSLISPDLLRELAVGASMRPLIIAAGAPAEPGYRPSRALAEFVRARDLTCRAPGCDRPATDCDLDHTVPWSDGGATHRSNIKCLCRFHHLAKTFWGWRDRQLPDGTVIWTLPDNQTYITTPGSALLFPNLMTPTGTLPDPNRQPRCGERTAKMPLRKTTRAANRARAITTERARNHQLRTDPDDPPF